MLIVILILSAVATICGWVVASKNKPESRKAYLEHRRASYSCSDCKNSECWDDVKSRGWVPLIAGIIIFVCAVIATFAVGGQVVNARTIAPQLEMHQTENYHIQQSVGLIVQNYMDFERSTFTELQTTSPLVLISLFPDLSSNELVNTQIELYIRNNERIRSLRTAEIRASNYRWWLFFGGI